MASRKLRCTVVEITPSVRTRRFDISYSEQNRACPDLLPWADPYIAQLAATLQEQERRERMLLFEAAPPCSEAEPPLCEPNIDFDITRRNASWPRERLDEEESNLRKRAG